MDFYGSVNRPLHGTIDLKQFIKQTAWKLNLHSLLCIRKN